MLAIRLNDDVLNRLQMLSDKTGRTKTYYAREAILNYLQDMEDYYLSVDRLKNPAKRWDLDDIIAGKDK